MSSIQILIVEDEFLVAEEIRHNIALLGFEVSAWVDNGKEAIQQVIKNKPDLAIMDIRIKGELDGIETASQLAKDYHIPIIYLTDQSDQETYDRAKTTAPHAFLAKPVTATSLQRSIELAVTQVFKEQKERAGDLEGGQVLNKHFMLKNKEGLYAIKLQEIVYLEADKQYCFMHVLETLEGESVYKKWHITRSMGKLLESLHRSEYCRQHLIRIGRSHCVNLERIKSIEGSKIKVEEKEFSIGNKEYRDLLFQHIATI